MNQKLPGVSILFRDSWDLYKSRFRIFTSILILPVAFILVAAILGNALLSSIFAVVSVIFFIVAYPAIIYSITNENQSDVKTSYGVGFGKLFPYLWLAILTNLVVIGGLIMGVIPGLMFSFWFIFSVFILFVEDKRGLEALLKSKEYVRGYFWPVLGRIILLVLCVVVIAMMLSLVIGEDKRSEDVLNAVLQLFVMPFFISYSFNIYRGLQALKPGLVQAPAPAKRGFFIFSAVLGLVALVVVPIIIISVSGSRFF